MQAEINALDFHDLEPAARAAGRSLSLAMPPRPDATHWRLDGRRYDTTEAVRAALQGEVTMSDYELFLAQKHERAQSYGFEPATPLHSRLFAFQYDVVQWAIRQGRAAIFADTGLGKTAMQAEYARHVLAHTGRPVLIVAPLAVAHQTIAEAALMGLSVTYARSQAEVTGPGLYITNYDRITAFDGSAFAGVVLDESSILKAYTGKTKQALVSQFANTPYRLACTATPAPNDWIELGNHAEFLGVMPSHEMLSKWFINDSMKAGGYRLKGHAEGAYWRWVASWAACISKPSDLGYADDGYALPPLEIEQRTVAADVGRLMEATGSFVAASAMSATRLWKDKAETAPARCQVAAEFVAAEPDEPWILWVSTDAEADLLMAALAPQTVGREGPAVIDAVEVRGSDKPEDKEARLMAFANSQVKCLVTKAKIAGFGMNFQHCARMAFVGITYSFEYLYQALRRCYRFGQLRAVHAHLIVAETEANVLAAIQTKQTAHQLMQRQMTQAMRETGLLAQQSNALQTYHAPVVMKLPSWLKRKAA